MKSESSSNLAGPESKGLLRVIRPDNRAGLFSRSEARNYASLRDLRKSALEFGWTETVVAAARAMRSTRALWAWYRKEEREQHDN